ncbi:MAG: hypothetical protein ABI216_04610 [Devosia sp.]
MGWFRATPAIADDRTDSLEVAACPKRIRSAESSLWTAEFCVIILAHGHMAKVQRARARRGDVSYLITSRINDGMIDAVVDPAEFPAVLN